MDVSLSPPAASNPRPGVITSVYGASMASGVIFLPVGFIVTLRLALQGYCERSSCDSTPASPLEFIGGELLVNLGWLVLALVVFAALKSAARTPLLGRVAALVVTALVFNGLTFGMLFLNTRATVSLIPLGVLIAPLFGGLVANRFVVAVGSDDALRPT
jgi:hypothetical protein